MYRGFVNYLRGQTVLEVSCAAPERVVNLCSANGVPFWNVVWLTGERLRFTTTRDGEKYLKTLVGQLDAEVSVVRRSGAPELWRRVKRRYVLLGAAAVLPLVLALVHHNRTFAVQKPAERKAVFAMLCLTSFVILQGAGLYATFQMPS